MTLPNSVFALVDRASSIFRSDELEKLIRTANKRRLFNCDWWDSDKDWAPFDVRLRQMEINRRNVDHLLALEVVLGARMRMEKGDRKARRR